MDLGASAVTENDISRPYSRVHCAIFELLFSCVLFLPSKYLNLETPAGPWGSSSTPGYTHDGAKAPRILHSHLRLVQKKKP